MVTRSNDPSVLRGRCSKSSDSIGRCELQKMEHSIWGCDGTEQLINEGKDQERYGHVEQPAYPGVDDLVAMLNPAYMVGQLERGENGTLHWQFAIQWSHSRSFAAIKKDLPLAHFEEVRSWGGSRPVLPEGGL